MIPDTVTLIRRAKEGDRQAWNELCSKYYGQWLERYHNRLGQDMRGGHDTDDLVQSAVGDALRDIRQLRSEPAFFSWVCAIIQRKIATARRNQRVNVVPIEVLPEQAMPAMPGLPADPSEDGYVRLLDGMISLFPDYPDYMAAVYLQYFAQLDRATQAQAMGRSIRTVHRLTQSGVALLRSVLV
jgi:DNA-directed RNA polymerase specialized sigma24 family protein